MLIFWCDLTIHIWLRLNHIGKKHQDVFLPMWFNLNHLPVDFCFWKEEETWDAQWIAVMSSHSHPGKLPLNHHLQTETWGCFSSEVCQISCCFQWHHSRPLTTQGHHQLPEAWECHCHAWVHWVDQPTQHPHTGSCNEDESIQRSSEERGSLPMFAGEWGCLQGCKVVSGSTCLSSSFWPQPPYLPGYRCIKDAQVGIHACAAQATRQIMSCNSM